MTLKHFLIGVGLHNLTGLKSPIQILSHLGHPIDYNIVCQIETAEAEKALQFYEKDGILCSLEPANETSMVLTYFWADKFNQNLESQTGHGVIDYSYCSICRK